MDSYSLPYDAKGIDSDEFSLSFSQNRIVLIPKLAGCTSEEKDQEKHYTLSIRQDSGVIDIHETIVLPDRSKRYRTLFAIREEDFLSALQGVKAMVPELFSLFRPLRLGWLKHRHINIVLGSELGSDEEIAAITRKRKRKLVLDPKLYKDKVFALEYLEEIYDFADGNFSLWYRNSRIGIGFKRTDGDGRVHLSWIKLSDLLRFGYNWQEKVMNALQTASIPPDRYGDYRFLVLGH